MAETDILNPPDWRNLGLAFNPNPSYGFSRRISNNRQTQRPRLGPFIERQIGNGGHIFPLTWVNTDLTTKQRVVKFYHDFRSGYFTYIDADGGGRHFAGRFTSEPEVVETANGKWTIQGATFEEVPRARMLQYPSDWTNDGHTINVLDDNLNPLVALVLGTWTVQIAPNAPPGSPPTQPSVFEAYAPQGLQSTAIMQYVGWGFQMTFRLDPTFGALNLYLDGVLLVNNLDLGTGAAGTTLPIVLLALSPGVSITVIVTDVPLDQHRVKVYGNGPGAGGGSAIIFPPLEYIY